MDDPIDKLRTGKDATQGAWWAQAPMRPGALCDVQSEEQADMIALGATGPDAIHIARWGPQTTEAIVKLLEYARDMADNDVTGHGQEWIGRYDAFLAGLEDE